MKKGLVLMKMLQVACMGVAACLAGSVMAEDLGPARDYSADAAFIAEYKEAAMAIARRKMAEVDAGVKANPTVVPTGRRLATGGGFGGFFLWDSAFAVMWARHLDGAEFPYHSTLDNFYALATPTGFISREYNAQGYPCWLEKHPISFASPILSWAEVTLYREGKSDKARLAKVYGPLKRHHEVCRRSFRRPDGLYFGDKLGCGMDDIKRWPVGMSNEERMNGGILFTKDCLGEKTQGWWDTWCSKMVADWSWNRQAGWIDLSSEMALDALCLAEIAEAIGKTDEAKAFRGEHAEIAKAVNAKCWDEARGFYFDVTDSGIIERYFVGAYWTLVAKIAPPERARKLVEKLNDPKFFGTPIAVPSIATCEPDYEPETAYWRGACWPPTTYMVICGLRENGFTKEAEDIARKWYNANAELFVRTKTVWENISPEQCHRPKKESGGDFCGWSALAPIAIPVEFGWNRR